MFSDKCGNIWDMTQRWRNLSRDTQCVILSRVGPWATRVHVVSETPVRAVCGWPVRAQMCRASGCSVYTPRRLSGSLSPGRPKLVLILRKNLRMVRPWRMPRIPTSCGDKFPCDNLSNHCTVVFFKISSNACSFLSYLLASRNGSIFLLGPCQIFVVQSLAFSFRLSKVKSLM